MSNIYMEYLTESEREELILEKELELEILNYDNEYTIEASIYAKGYGSKLDNAKDTYRRLTKSAKKNIKKGNFDDAEKEIKEAKKILIDLRDQLEKEKPGLFSNLFDSILLLLPFFLMSTIGLITIPTGAGVFILNTSSFAATLTTIISELNTALALIKKQIKEYKKTKHLKDVQMDDLNIYKNSAINSLDKCIKACDKLLETVEKAKKKNNNGWDK